MLYFTFLEKKTGAWRAIYNGRFAFLLKFPPDMALGIGLVDPENPARGTMPKDVHESLSEEEKHKTLFMDCESGLFLNGLRFLVRLTWLVSKREGLPRLYYRLRTQFFLRMYDPHEELASLPPLEKGKADPKFEILKARIAAEDHRLIAHWREMLGRKLLLLKPVALLLGRALSRHFAVVTVDAKSSGRTATNVSAGGWLNTSGSFGKREGRKVEHILTWLRPEAWIQVSKTDTWRWMILKFQEERREVMRQVEDPNQAEDRYTSYVQNILAFLSIYMEIRDQRSVYRLEKLLLDVEVSAAQPPPEAWLNREDLFAIVGFFYGHGN